MSKFVEAHSAYNYPDKGSYLQLFVLCLFALIILYLKSFVLYLYNSDYLLSLFNVRPLILCLIFSIDNPYYFVEKFSTIKLAIQKRLVEIYMNIKSDPCYYISYKITMLLSMKYAFVIVFLLFSFS